VRKAGRDSHNKSIGALPDTGNPFGLQQAESHGTLGGAEGRNKNSIDSADLLQRNMRN